MTVAQGDAQARLDAQETGPGPLALLGRAIGIRLARLVDHGAVLAAVREDAGWSHRYAFMTLMSAGIALLGLLLSSPAVVIGAMLVSPLMGPIIGLGFAFATFDWPRVRESGMALLAGAALAVAFCAIIVLLSPLQAATSEILARTRPNLFDLLVAIFSALAGAYATIRGRGATIVGVAIATALMPPLAVVGYGLATGQRSIWGGALTLFITNFVAIAASAAVMARLYGFGTRLSPRQTRLQAWLLLGVMALLAVPLALALRNIAGEAAAARELRLAVADVLGGEARLGEVEVRREAGALRIEAVAIAPSYVADARGRIEAEIERRTGRDVTLRLVQLRSQDGEAVAMVETARASEARRAAADAEIRALRSRLALAAGQPATAVSMDPQTRLARVVAAAGEPISVAGLRALEARLAADFEGWTVRLVPPIGAALPALAFAPGSAEPEPGASETADTIAWALARWEVPAAEAIGSAAPSGDAPSGEALALAEARAEALAALLRERGVPASVAAQVAPATVVAEQGAAAARSASARPAAGDNALAAGGADPDPAPGTPAPVTPNGPGNARTAGAPPAPAPR